VEESGCHKGYLGKGWERFATELESFFLGKKSPVEFRDGQSRNGKNPGMERRDPRDFAAPIQPLLGSKFPFKNPDLNLSKTRAPLNPSAPRPTRKFSFIWEPKHKTLRITKLMGEKRQAQWVGLKYKAHRLALSKARAFPQAQVLPSGSGAQNLELDPMGKFLEPSLISPCPVDPSIGNDGDSSNDELDEVLQPSIEPTGMVDECSQGDFLPPSAVWVDLASSDRDSQLTVGIEAPCFPFLSDTVFETGESSQTICYSLAGVDVVSFSELPLAIVEEPTADTASPLRCEPLAMLAPSRPPECGSGSPLEPSVWVK
jgi:hypothetical protein